MNPPFFARETTCAPRAGGGAAAGARDAPAVEAAEQDLRVAEIARAARVDEARARAAAAEAAARHGRDTRPKLPDIDETREYRAPRLWRRGLSSDDHVDQLG